MRTFAVICAVGVCAASASSQSQNQPTQPTQPDPDQEESPPPREATPSSNGLAVSPEELARLKSGPAEPVTEMPRPVVAPPPRDPLADRKYWCSVLIANGVQHPKAGSCEATLQECEESRARFIDGGLEHSECEWQGRAACYPLRNRLYNKTVNSCHPSFQACQFDRSARQREPHVADWDVRGSCKAEGS